MLKSFLLFLLIYECSASLVPLRDSPSDLPKLICDAADEVSKQEVRTIAIVELRHNFQSRFFDEVHKCMPVNVAMVQLNLRSAVVDVKLKEAKLVVVVGDDVEWPEFMKLVGNQDPKSIFSHLAKFLFVSSHKLNGISEILPANGIFNFAAAFEDENGEPRVEVSNHFTNTSEVLGNVPKSEIMAKLYPNKLSNMHKAPIRVLVHQRMPDVEVKDGKVISIHSPMFDLIAETLNATIEKKVVETQIPFLLIDELLGMFKNRVVDTTLGTIPPILPNLPKVFSYIENGICALVPSPAATPYYLYALTSSLEVRTMVMLALTTAIYMGFWKIFQLRGEATRSSWNVTYGLIASFCGQGFNFRTLNQIMRWLLMIHILGTFVMSNFYQASLTTLVTQPMPQHHFTTIDELFGSKFNFTVQAHAEIVMDYMPEYQKAAASGKVTTVFGNYIGPLETIQIATCDTIESYMRREALTNFYIFPHRLVSFYNVHDMGFMNPYTDEIQSSVTKTYSVGLHKAWKSYYELELFGAWGHDKAENHFELLKFEDIWPLFWILPIGFGVALMVLLLEIINHKFSKKFSRQNLYGLLWRKKARMMRVRRIQVQPINETEM